MLDDINFALQIVGILAVLAASISCGLFIAQGRHESWNWNSSQGLLTTVQFAILALFILSLIVGDPLSEEPGDLQPDWNFQD